MMHYWGKIKLVYFTLLTIAASLILFGCLYWVNNKTVFMILGIISRILNGVGVGGFSSIAASYMPILYPDTKIQMITYI